jgi:hypothetical protein
MLPNLQNKNVDYLLNMIFFWSLAFKFNHLAALYYTLSQKPVLKTQFLLNSLPHHLKLSDM